MLYTAMPDVYNPLRGQGARILLFPLPKNLQITCLFIVFPVFVQLALSFGILLSFSSLLKPPILQVSKTAVNSSAVASVKSESILGLTRQRHLVLKHPD